MSIEKVEEALGNFRKVMKRLESIFVARDREIEYMFLSGIAQEPLLFIGEPGTGKSELVTQFKKQVALPEEKYFEYCLTKFTEPSEIIGPLDLKKMKEGTFYRKTEGKLPTAEMVFLDEVFKSNSAILNTLLTILNERKFYQDGKPQSVPLKMLFSATNEIPALSELDALKDRFTLKVKVNPVGKDNWDDLLRKGSEHSYRKHFKVEKWGDTLISIDDFILVNDYLQKTMSELFNEGKDSFFDESLYNEFKRVVTYINTDLEIKVSDRKFIKLYKLIRSRALLIRGGSVEKEDFIILEHLGNTVDEIDLLRKSLPEVIFS